MLYNDIVEKPAVPKVEEKVPQNLTDDILTANISSIEPNGLVTITFSDDLDTSIFNISNFNDKLLRVL
jgi:hypothetical protein